MGELIDLKSVAWALGNLVILFFVIRYFFYKPVVKFMNSRRAKFSDEREQIDADRKIVIEEKRDYRRILEGAQKEADQATYRKLVEAEDRAQQILDDARRQAEQAMRDAVRSIEEERKRAEAQMREEVVSMAIALSGKILGREVGAADNKRIIDDFFAKVD